MHLSENEGIEGNVFVVTGGLGFVGSALCLELVRREAQEVRAFDLRKCSPWSVNLQKSGVRCIQGDVCQKADVGRALRGADCVFHLAAFGMSGKEMLQVGRVDEVNINGTCNVLDMCLELGVRRLVYVSTYNVVFGGREIVNGNEALQYFPVDEHVDPYGRSKSFAEQLVLKSNGRPSKKKKGACLYTCAIRPAAIYGPGEERHLPRIVSMAKWGLVVFKIGEANVKTDWVYLDNLVLALLLASMGLLDDIPGKVGQPVAAGQPYFISDGSPVNTFEFIRPLLKSVECDIPNSTLSVQHALLLASFFSAIYTILYPWLNRSWVPQPFILPAEVHKNEFVSRHSELAWMPKDEQRLAVTSSETGSKLANMIQVGVTHYFSLLKAKTELGYVPMVSPQEGMAATISYWQKRVRAKLDGPTIYAWLFSTAGMCLLFYAAWLPAVWPLHWVNILSLFFFRSLQNVRVAFSLATAVHICEAAYAWYLAKRVDPSNSRAWFWQTLALGGLSLRYLIKRSKKGD